MRIKVDLVRHHRNGGSGAPFFVVAFRYRQPGERKERQLVATLFDEPEFVAVIEPANLRNRWRGDNFETALRAAVAEAERNGSAYDYSATDN